MILRFIIEINNCNLRASASQEIGTYVDVNVDMSEMGDDHQEDPLEEDILLAVGEHYILRPYFGAVGFDDRQKADDVLRDAAAGEIPQWKRHDPGKDQ